MKYCNIDQLDGRAKRFLYELLLIFIRELEMPERLEVSESACLDGILSLMEKGYVELVKDEDVYSLRPTEPPAEEAGQLPIPMPGVVAEAEAIANREWQR